MNFRRMILAIPLQLFAILVQSQDCESLKDGNYKVKFKKGYGGATYILKISSGRFTEIRGSDEISGDVLLNENCALRLDYPVKWDTTNHLQKVLLKSDGPYFDFDGTKGKRINFRLTGYGGPHVTSGEGVFSRIE